MSNLQTIVLAQQQTAIFNEPDGRKYYGASLAATTLPDQFTGLVNPNAALPVTVAGLIVDGSGVHGTVDFPTINVGAPYAVTDTGVTIPALMGDSVVIQMVSTDLINMGHTIVVSEGSRQGTFTVTGFAVDDRHITATWQAAEGDSAPGTVVQAPATITDSVTTTTAGFAIPLLVGGSVSVPVVDSTDMTDGITVLVSDGVHKGTFAVNGFPDGVHFTGVWTQAAGDSAGGTTILSPANVTTHPVSYTHLTLPTIYSV